MKNVVLSIKEAAVQANITEAQVRRLLRKGKIEGVKVGKEWRINQQALDKFLGINTDTKILEKDAYIRELECKVRAYEVQITAFKNIVMSLGKAIGIK